MDAQTQSQTATARQSDSAVGADVSRSSRSNDFVGDALGSGRRFRTLNIVDDYTREAVAIEVDTSLGGVRVCRVLGQLKIERGGVPVEICSDNGPEFTSRAVEQWADGHGVEWHFIEPRRPSRTLTWKASTASSATSA